MVRPAAQTQPAASPRVLSSEGPRRSRRWAYRSSPTSITAGGDAAPSSHAAACGPPGRGGWAPRGSPEQALTHEGAQAADEAEEAALGRQGAALAVGTRRGEPSAGGLRGARPRAPTRGCSPDEGDVVQRAAGVGAVHVAGLVVIPAGSKGTGWESCTAARDPPRSPNPGDVPAAPRCQATQGSPASITPRVPGHLPEPLPERESPQRGRGLQGGAGLGGGSSQPRATAGAAPGHTAPGGTGHEATNSSGLAWPGTPSGEGNGPRGHQHPWAVPPTPGGESRSCWGDTAAAGPTAALGSPARRPGDPWGPQQPAAPPSPGRVSCGRRPRGPRALLTLRPLPVPQRPPGPHPGGLRAPSPPSSTLAARSGDPLCCSITPARHG